MKKRKKPGPKPIVPEMTYQASDELTLEQHRGLDRAFDILFEETWKRWQARRTME